MGRKRGCSWVRLLRRPVVRSAQPLCGAQVGPQPSVAAATYSANPVRFGDGVVKLPTNDLGSAGFGTPWGVDRSWSSGPGYADASHNGNGWVVSELPTLLDDEDTDAETLVLDADNALFFTGDGANLSPRFAGQQSLAHNTTDQTFTMTDRLGNRMVLNDYYSGVPAAQCQRALKTSH